MAAPGELNLIGMVAPVLYVAIFAAAAKLSSLGKWEWRTLTVGLVAAIALSIGALVMLHAADLLRYAPIGE